MNRSIETNYEHFGNPIMSIKRETMLSPLQETWNVITFNPDGSKTDTFKRIGAYRGQISGRSETVLHVLQRENPKPGLPDYYFYDDGERRTETSPPKDPEYGDYEGERNNYSSAKTLEYPAVAVPIDLI